MILIRYRINRYSKKKKNPYIRLNIMSLLIGFIFLNCIVIVQYLTIIISYSEYHMRILLLYIYKFSTSIIKVYHYTNYIRTYFSVANFIRVADILLTSFAKDLILDNDPGPYEIGPTNWSCSCAWLLCNMSFAFWRKLRPRAMHHEVCVLSCDHTLIDAHRYDLNSNLRGDRKLY